MTAFKFNTGQLEFLKWLALVLMLGDHINTSLFNHQLPAISEMARIVFPIFAIVFGYNLARPGVDYPRVLSRLWIIALISQFPHYLAFPHSPLLLNVLFTLASAGTIIWLLQKPTWIEAGQAICVFLLAGVFVDYSWFGILVVLSAWLLFRFPTLSPRLTLLTVLGSLISLYVPNGNFYALAAVPVIVLASKGTWSIPRCPWAFYAFYPAHLTALALLVRLHQ